MTDLARDDDAEEQRPNEEPPAGEVTPPEDDAPREPEVASEETPAPPDEAPAAEDEPEAAAGTSEAAVQVSQDALFNADLAPAVRPEAGDEGVTAFGAPPDDLEAIRAELGDTEAEAEPVDGTPVQEPVTTEPVTAEPVTAEAEIAAEETAETEALEAVVAGGVPEGQDDDPEAVEALLDSEAAEGLLEPPDRTLSVPFYVYVGVWLLFSIAMVLVLRTAAIAGALDTASAYPAFVLAALVLTVLGPLMAVFLWWLSRSHAAPGERTGLFAVAMLRGALATFAGVMLWTIARVLLDYFRTGRFF